MVYMDPVNSTKVIRNSDGGTDIWRASDLGLALLPILEHGTRLGHAYGVWRRCIGDAGDALPRADSFHLQLAEEEAPWTVESIESILPNPFVADTAPECPGDFRISVPKANVFQRALRDIAEPLFQRALFSDLVFCKGVQEPLYQQIRQTVLGQDDIYIRILLPTVDEENNVCRIHAVSRPLVAARTLTRGASYII